MEMYDLKYVVQFAQFVLQCLQTAITPLCLTNWNIHFTQTDCFANCFFFVFLSMKHRYVQWLSKCLWRLSCFLMIWSELPEVSSEWALSASWREMTFECPSNARWQPPHEYLCLQSLCPSASPELDLVRLQIFLLGIPVYLVLQESNKAGALC